MPPFQTVVDDLTVFTIMNLGVSPQAELAAIKRDTHPVDCYGEVRYAC